MRRTATASAFLQCLALLAAGAALSADPAPELHRSGVLADLRYGPTPGCGGFRCEPWSGARLEFSTGCELLPKPRPRNQPPPPIPPVVSRVVLVSDPTDAEGRVFAPLEPGCYVVDVVRKPSRFESGWGLYPRSVDVRPGPPRWLRLAWDTGIR